MNKKRLAIIGTVGIPARYGGFETLAEHLVRGMSDTYEISVYCTGRKYTRSERKKSYLGARLIYWPIDANGVWSIAYDCLSILHALWYADVLLVLGVPGGLLFPFVRRFTKKKLIVSIDGIEWKRDKWSRPARWYLWWAEKMAVKYSHADIADNESIQDYTAVRYGTVSHIIEYGADHTLEVPIGNAYTPGYPFLSVPYACKVCRIEPENNVEMVLEAFSRQYVMPFVLIGNWQNSEYGRRLKLQYACRPGLFLLDPIYDQERLDLIRGNASLYIHGHCAGGTNPSLVEAMYLGLPIAAFGVSYNKTTTEGKAWYFSDAGELAALISGLGPQRLAEKAADMKRIADRRYTWAVIARKYAYLVERVMTTTGKVRVIPKASHLAIAGLLELEMAHLANTLHFYEKR